MKKSILTLALILSATCLSAQVSPDAQAQTDALKLRSDMTEAVSRGTETPEAALARLKTHAALTGLQIDADADFAFAAIDLGRRLIAAGTIRRGQSEGVRLRILILTVRRGPAGCRAWPASFVSNSPVRAIM